MAADQVTGEAEDAGTAVRRVLEAEQQAEALLQAADEAAAESVRAAREQTLRVLSRADARVRAVRQSHPQRLAVVMSAIESRRTLAGRETSLGEAEERLIRHSVVVMADELLGVREGE